MKKTVIKRWLSILTVLILFAVNTPQYAFAGSLDQWTVRSPWPTGNILNGAAYGNGMYVAVGGYGAIVTSGDGVNWMSRTSGTTSYLNGAAYGSGIYVAVGDSGTIVTSGDGASWTSRSSGTANELWDIAYGNGTYVAVGNSGTILTSGDGASWTSRTSGTAKTLRGVAYGNGTFVAVGDSGTILISSDGTSWASKTSGFPNTLYAAAYGNGLYVAVGDVGTILTSADGANWTSQATGTFNNLYGVAYAGGKYLAVGHSGTILSSGDGTSWTSATSGTANMLWNIAYGSGTYVAVGDAGTILTSSDGASWTNRMSGTTNWLRGVAYGNVNGSGLYVSAGDSGTILISSDGTSWASKTSGFPNTLYAAAYGSGIFVAVGSNGTILTSGDGTNWTSRTSGTVKTLRGVAYGNGSFVAVGSSGTIVTSSDGTNWTIRTSGTAANLYGVAYGNGMYVAVGAAVPGGTEATIVTSGDGVNWTSGTNGTAEVLYGVVYGQGKFVATGLFGAVVTSSDGASWMSRTSGTSWNLYGVAYGSGTFVAVGVSRTVLTSSDGVNWTIRTTGTPKTLYSVAYGDGMYVAAGESGTILQAYAATDADAVAEDKATLAVTFASGDSAASVTQDVYLPTAGTNGTTISWTSDQPGAIDNAGYVTRPAFNNGDASVTLTATITKGSASDTKSFVLTVVRLAQSEAEAVEVDKSTLAVGYGSGDNAASVTQDVYLPTAGTNGSTITWTSDKPAVIDSAGNVTRPAFNNGDATVTLTATITKGSASDMKSFVLTVAANSAASGGGGRKKTSHTNASPSLEIKEDSAGGVKVIVNPSNIVKEIAPNGTVVEKVIFSEDMLTKVFDALKGQSGENKITVDINDTGQAVQVQFPAASIAAALSSVPDAVIEVKLNGSSFQFVISVLNLDVLAERLGAKLEDLKVNVVIEYADNQTVNDLEQIAASQGFNVVGNVIGFKVTVEAGGKTVDVRDFGGTYLVRAIVLDDKKANKNMTAVLYDPSTKTVSFVPSLLSYRADGKREMVVKVPHNSLYTVIESTEDGKTFVDVKGHWAQKDVELIASKRIMLGVSNRQFAPDANITRAEFAALLVRSLGLSANAGAASTRFVDVAADAWYASEVKAAVDAGLASGITADRFAPNAWITREQMAVMFARALELAGKPAEPVNRENRALAKFTDWNQVSPWARDEMAQTLKAGLLFGITGDTIAPSQYATRAQTAAMLKRFLQYVQFIDS